MTVPVLIFATVTAGVAASFQLLSESLFPHATRVRRRLAEEFRKGYEGGRRPLLFKGVDQLSVDPRTGGMSDLGMAELAPPPTRSDWGLQVRLQTMLEQANLCLSVSSLIALAGALALILGALGMIYGLLAGVPAALVGAVTPFAYVHFKRKARQEKFLKQLPGAFELMARVLRGGHTVPQALQAVADSLDEPVAGEFARCQKQQNLGLRAEITFQELAWRTGIVEMRIFVMAMLLQRHVGGNLSDVLERLAHLVRSRLRLRDQVRTLTAEGRLQGLMLLVLPFVMFGALLVVNRQYAMTLFDHVSLLAAMGVSMLVGILWIRKIINFEA
jgi:tight adherence protein B